MTTSEREQARPGRRWASALGGLLVSGLLLGWLFARVDLGELVRILERDVDLLRLAPVLAFDLVFYLAKSARWRTILAPVGRFDFRGVFEAIVLGATSNNVLPLRLDELVRVGWLTRRRPGIRAEVLGTVVVDRICDLVALGTATIVAALLLPGIAAFHRGLALVGAVLGAAMAGVLLVCFGPRRLLGARLGAILAGLERGVRSVPLRRWPRLVGWTALEWTALALLTATVLHAFELEVGAEIVLVVVVANYLSFAIPSGPGSLGVFEVLIVTVLGLVVSATSERELAFALVYHALLMIPVSVLGGGLLVARGLRARG